MLITNTILYWLFHLRICGSDRVAGSIRIRKSVEKRMQAPFEQLNKWFLQRVLPGPTQHTMFQYVWNPHRILPSFHHHQFRMPKHIFNSLKSTLNTTKSVSLTKFSLILTEEYGIRCQRLYSHRHSRRT